MLRNNDFEFQLFPDEKLLSAEELIDEDNDFINMFLEKRGFTHCYDKEKAVEELKKYQKMDYNIFLKKNSFLSIPYYSVKKNKVTYVPFFSANLHYGSNGMCAGNTGEEALVQGISEIIERIVQTKIVMDQVKLPDVPEEYLKRYPSIYEMYKIVKSLDDYSIFLKDCSFGGKYSAVALIIVEKNTGRFGVKCGAHPDYNIAIERLFTEATQGISLENFAKKTVLDFYNRGVSTRTNLMNGFKTADAFYPYQLLCDDSEYEFTEPKDVTNLSNKEMLKNMISLFIDEGYDVLIHDTSYLGFPSYQILVPGLSEMNYPDKTAFEAENTRFHVQKLICQPKYINKENCKYVISVLNYYKHSLMDNSMNNLTGYMLTADYPGKEVNLDHYYFLSMCYVLMEDYEEAAKQMQLINYSIRERKLPDNTKYLCIQYYLEAMVALKNHDMAVKYIYKMFDKKTADEIQYLFAETDKVLVKQYPEFDIEKVRAAEDEKMTVIGKEYLMFEVVLRKYKEKQKQISINQMDIKSLI